MYVPYLSAGGFGSSTDVASAVAYGVDAEYLASRSRDVLTAERLRNHMDAENDTNAELALARLEAWHAARATDGWTARHAGKRQPGEWAEMPLWREDKTEVTDAT